MKGIIVGGVISAGAAYMYKGMSGRNKRNMIKKGKQFAKKMGMM